METIFKPLYNTLQPILFQNDLVQTPTDFCEQAKHIQGPHKNVYATLRSWIAFTKLENYIRVRAGTMDQLESIVQPMNPWENKEDRQVI